jgi:hypothetical protein
MILMVHPIPYYDQKYTFEIIDMFVDKSRYVPVDYYLGDFLFAFMFMRFYFLIRTLVNFSLYSELFSKKVCAKYGVEPNMQFCLKALMQKKPGSTILTGSIISILWLSYLLRIFERIYY